ncbi:type I restriction enzyme subunit R domain-containing protein, partial [Parvimonas sp. M20]|uniref:type I restriction enzyme subunit R domain-containing protein n=1 Tax=Parvimonas sp. M20 TaxID=3110693 RepID=UPI002B488373
QDALQEEKRLKVAKFYSFSDNEEPSAIGDLEEENFEPSAMDSTAKEFLNMSINYYNKHFKSNFSTEVKEFQNYYS